MKIVPTRLSDVVIIEPKIISDERGLFFESYNLKNFSDAMGREIEFVQDNESVSKQAVLRGLHYQVVKPQGKLVRVSEGEVYDVAVDIRRDSATFGQWVGVKLSGENKRQLWIPEGFAHGFLVMSTWARFHYKVTDYWHASHERCIRFDDPQIDIHWPDVQVNNQALLSPILSEKDRQGAYFKDSDTF
jgi:dTDP-4-dehydrorhamnose 3,5-epimerase